MANNNAKFDEKVLRLIQEFVDECHPDGQLHNDRYLVLVGDGIGVATYVLFQPTIPKGYGPARMEQERTFGRWVFGEDGQEIFLGQ